MSNMIIHILITKPTSCTNFSNLFLEWSSTCFGQYLCLSSGVQHCIHSNRYMSYRLCRLLASGIRIQLASSRHKLSWSSGIRIPLASSWHKLPWSSGIRIPLASSRHKLPWLSGIRIPLASSQHNLPRTPDDGQRYCPKHVELHSKNKFEKLVHLVGFVIRIYHNARSSIK